jgi:predicted GNAT family N-acyltransferase
MDNGIKADFSGRKIINHPVESASWSAKENSIRQIRTEVFIREQCIPEDEEFDEADLTAVHVLVRNPAGEAVGTARLIENRKIGRVAVLKPWRGRGAGAAMIRHLMQVAREKGATCIELDAQTYAIPFYERLGYLTQGDEFMDAGIPHKKMIFTFRKVESEDA